MKRKSRIFLLVLVSFLLLAVFMAGIAILLTSRKVEEFARKMLAARIAQTTAATCSIRDLHFYPMRGQIRIDGLEVQALPHAPKPFSLSVEQIRAALGIRSLIQSRLNLKELILVRPRLVLVGGATTSQWDPSGFLTVFNRSLEFEAGKVEIQDGWFDLDDRHIPLRLTLDDLICSLRYTPSPLGYCVHLAYKRSHFLWAGRDIFYNLDLRANLTATGIDFESITFQREKSLFVGDGWMRDWKAPALLFHVSGSLGEDELALFEPSLRDIHGGISVRANLGWLQGAFRAMGKFGAPAIVYRNTIFKRVQGVLEIKDDVLQLQDVTGLLGEGHVRAEGEFHLRAADKTPHRVAISANGVRLKDVSAVLEFPMIGFENTADGDVRIAWLKGIRDLEVSGTAQLMPLPETSVPSAGYTELKGTVAFQYIRGLWNLPSASLSSPHTSLDAQGSDKSLYHVHLDTNRLPEVFRVVRPFSDSLANAIASHPDLMDITGSYHADLDIRIESNGNASYKGPISIHSGKWRSYAFDGLHADASWNEPLLQLRSLSLGKEGQTAEGNISLDFSDPNAAFPGVTFQGNVARFDLATLKSYGIDLEGEPSGLLSWNGTISNPSGKWRGDGQVFVEKGSFGGESFDSLHTRLNIADSSLHFTDCRVARGAAKVDVQGQLRIDTRELNLSARLSGFNLTNVPAIRDQKLEIAGTINGQGVIKGTLENPSFTGTAALEGLRYTSWDLGRGQVTLNLTNRLLHGTADFRSAYGNFKVQADISTAAGNSGRAVVELSDWNVQKLIAGNTPSYLSDLSTALQGKMEIQGSFADPESLRYAGDLDGARLKIRNYELRNAAKIKFSIQNQKVHLEDVRFVGEGSNLSLNGDIPLEGSLTLGVRLNGRANLKMLERAEKGLKSAGTAILDVRASGSIREPQIFGQVTLENGRFEYGDFPIRMSSVQGTIHFSRNLVRVESFEGSVASGLVRLTGALEHDTSAVSGINLQITLRKARLPFPKDFRSTIDADLSLRGNAESQVLAGEVRVLRADYNKEFNLMEQLASRSSSAMAPLTADAFWNGLRFNVGIDSESGINIDNELAKLTAGAQLTLRGTAAYPTLMGRIEAKEGSVFFRGNKFDILRGNVEFIERNRINPSVNVRAEADVKSYRVLLDVGGELDHLNVNMTSDPPLSTVDIVSLLTTGKYYESGTENSRRQAEITGLSAASILSQGITGALEKRVQRLFGLQSFRLDPFLAGEGNDPTARVTISERISKDLAVTFSRNLSTTEEQIVLVEYDVSKNLSVIATRDEDGKYALDFRFRRRFR